MQRLIVFGIFTGVLLYLAGCTKEVPVMPVMPEAIPEPVVVPKTFNVTVSLQAYVDGDSLVFGKGYINDAGEDFTVSTFRYYLSNFCFVTESDSLVRVPESYFLVDHALLRRTLLQFNLAEKKYKALRFLIGVDSARNYGGAQEGDLDPSLGMFWTWKSGYIMAKLEGLSSKAPAPGNAFIYHAGGSTSAKQVMIPFGNTYLVNGQRKLQLNLGANIAEWFRSPNLLSIEALPTVSDEGEKSIIIASNYADMFTLKSLQQ